jgi:hypothetical protein
MHILSGSNMIGQEIGTPEAERKMLLIPKAYE